MDSEIKWYQLEADDVLGRFNSSQDGLSEEEVKNRREKYGLNVLPQEKRFRVGLFLISQFKSPLVYILLIGGFISLGVKENFDALVIFVSVAVNVGIGFYQEYSSGKTLEKLTQVVKVAARVKRSGAIKEVNSEELIPGDIIYVKAGMKIPADARLIYAKNLHTN